MIWSVSKQPDYKVYLTQDELDKLISWNLIIWDFVNNISWNNIKITLSKDHELQSWITRSWFNELLISKKLLEELNEKWFIWGERLSWVTVKATLVVKERIDQIVLPQDDRDSLKWSLEIIEDKLGK